MTVDAAAHALRVAGVSKAFGDAVALDAVDLSVAAGSIIAILGPSGCGKTTLLRVVAGLESPDVGTVEIGGTLVAAPGVDVPTERRRVGVVFQHGALFPHLDVASNIAYGLPRGRRRHRRGEALDPRVAELLGLVGLDGFADRSIDTLSGGEAQRVALARALAPDPTLVLMDEPFASLDAQLRQRLRRDVAAVVRAAGATVVMVTHDRDEAFSVADEVVLLRRGAVVQQGPPRALYGRPIDAWSARFLGDVNLVAGRRDGATATTTLGVIPIVANSTGASGHVVVRPEELVVDATPDPTGAGVVTAEEYLGATTSVEVRLADGETVRVRSGGEAIGVGASVTVRRVATEAATWLPLAAPTSDGDEGAGSGHGDREAGDGDPRPVERDAVPDPHD